MSLPSVASPPSSASAAPASAQPSAGAATTTYDSLGTGTPTSTGAQGLPPGGAAAQPGAFNFLPFILMMFVVLILMTTMGGRKERKRRAAMMSGLKKHDKVVTVGGVIGQVAEIRDDEVTLLIDESSRTKMRVTKASIQQVLTSAPGSGSGNAGREADDLSAGAAEVKVKGKPETVGA